LSSAKLPNQPAACLTAASWKTAVAQKGVLPGEITGMVLTGGPLDNANSGKNEYTNHQLDVQSGISQVFSHDNLASISPDGKHLITIEKTFGDRWLMADASLWVLTPI
jgi:hypothetical protein